MDEPSTHREVIGEIFTRRNTTLGHPNGPIHLIGTIHVEAMEMKTCTLITQLILDIDDDSVSDGSCNGWQRPLPVDPHDRTHKSAIRVGVDPAYVEIIGHRCSIRDWDEAQGDECGYGRHVYENK